MRRLSFAAICAALLIFTAASGAVAATTNEPADFKEVYELLRSHLAGVNATDLDRAAVQGLLDQFKPKVSLVTGKAETNSVSDRPLLSKSALYEGPIAYLRVSRVDDGLANRITEAYQELDGTNKLKGVVLDLRFADGDNYAAAATAADLFLTKEEPLLDWGSGSAKSKSKKSALKTPVAILVNHDTAAAAEALAAALRETGAGLVLGGKTAGQAAIAQEFPLKNGQRLRIATTPIKLGNGEPISVQGIKPDIEVVVSAEDEKVYLADPFKELPRNTTLLTGTGSATNNLAGGTNRLARRRLNEAELVRERRDGISLDLDTNVPPVKDTELQKPVVRDPALARALDLLKGLAVVRQSRSN